LRVFAATSISLHSRCLATRGDIHADTQREGRDLRKFAVEMSSGAMIYTPGFIKIVSIVQKFIGVYTQTHRQEGDLVSLLSVSKLRKVG
jgi:hypothetical protein